jgi:hypothetical protein
VMESRPTKQVRGESVVLWFLGNLKSQGNVTVAAGCSSFLKARIECP